jgi:SAM-dependent methyltransferase
VPDVYATITAADEAVLERLAETLEIRAADPGQAAIRAEFLADVPLGQGARVAEIGCGTGPVVRALAALPGVASVVGIDPSPYFLERARQLATRHLANGPADVELVEGDARAVPLPDGSLDAVVFYTTLCHVPEPERALAEARRVLRPGGVLAAFDGDYATPTCALGAADPLQACIDASVEFLVHDRWLGRRLAALATEAGFAVERQRSHGYVEAPAARPYFTALIDRGADLLVAAGRAGPELAAALKAEGRRRSEAGTFFGHIAYASVLARRAA